MTTGCLILVALCGVSSFVGTKSFLSRPSMIPSPATTPSKLGSSTKETIDKTETSEAIEMGRSQLSNYFEFPLDDWQLQAGGEILLGHNVIVCAPTGSGKTVCGEMALHAAFDRGLNGVYTTPLKALSNQKFGELRQRFGAEDVGLSTGDVSINRQARLTVMTTEVYRNIAWRSSGSDMNGEEDDLLSLEANRQRNDLDSNAVVVLDEFHYMGVPGRGGVWEECVITSPAHTQIVGLSATLPNAKQLTEWMEGVTGRKTVLVEAPGKRPVPLTYMFATREGLFPLFKNPNAGPGSSLGLLGYRGDGEPTPGSKLDMIKNSDEESDDDHELEFGDEERLPRGLKVNPALKKLAQQRMARVNRMVEKQKAMQRQRATGGMDDEWDLYNNGRGRGGRGRWNKGGTMSNREERREKERALKREMRKAVPSLPVLLARLKAQNLLPAIFFIFSRAGCDQAADTIRNSFKGPRDPTVEVDFDEEAPKKKAKKPRQRGKRDRGDMFQDSNGRKFRPGSNNVGEEAIASFLEDNRATVDLNDFDLTGSPLDSEKWEFYSISGLLAPGEVESVAKRVAQFNDDNPEIAFPNNVIEQFLFGVGSHHAGMLPAHKAFVEALFRGNLMKGVFATETLAAGINMPARTTVVCGMAKRDGAGSMNLLETSNLLQMAGRAGRRGLDDKGTCVIVSTPFESHDVAAEILTNPIKPISSQFRPSYSLAVNLIARGKGRLDVAKQLVSKSFAMWEKRRIEDEMNSRSAQVSDVLQSVAEERFMTMLVKILEHLIDIKSSRFDISYLRFLVDVLKDREKLKKCSKDYEAALLSLELEQTTLGCLELEYKESSSPGQAGSNEDPQLMEQEDKDDMVRQVDEQRQRVTAARKKLRKHQFSSIANIANELMVDEHGDGRSLNRTFASINSQVSRNKLYGEDLSKFAKSAIVVKRKMRKLAKANPGVDPESMLLLDETAKEIEDSSWDDMLAITRVLLAYGCVDSGTNWDGDKDFKGIEDKVFEVTPAGSDVGMLNFENALWSFIGMGGTFDVIGSSSKYDELNAAMDIFDDDDMFEDDYGLFNDVENKDASAEQEADNLSFQAYAKAQNEAQELVAHLSCLSPGELAGYVSTFAIGESSRNSLSSMDVFKRLSPRQQRAIQLLLDSTERFNDVQRQFSIDERTCGCQFDVSNCEVITEW